MNVVQDIKTVVGLFVAVREVRRSGADGLQIRPVQALPILNLAPGFYGTLEGCCVHKLGRDTDRAVKDVFDGLPYETKARLEFTPKRPGEWAERARFWQRELHTLPSKMRHQVMMLFIGQYACCLRNRHHV